GGSLEAPNIFSVTDSDLASITASTLKIGSMRFSGGIVLQNNLDISGSGAGGYDLILANREGLSYKGYNIALGTRNLTTYLFGGTLNNAVHDLDLGFVFSGTEAVLSGSQFTGTAGGNIVLLPDPVVTLGMPVTLSAGIGSEGGDVRLGVLDL